MEPEIELNFLDIIRDFNRMGIRYLVIGRRAVVLYGAPVLTADYDFWIDAGQKQDVLDYFKDKECSLSEPDNSPKPIIHIYAGPRIVDLFFHRVIRNIEGELIEFVTCYNNSSIIEDREQRIYFRLPSIDDLVKTKKIRDKNVKDLQDIEYLLKVKEIAGDDE